MTSRRHRNHVKLRIWTLTKQFDHEGSISSGVEVLFQQVSDPVERYNLLRRLNEYHRNHDKPVARNGE